MSVCEEDSVPAKEGGGRGKKRQGEWNFLAGHTVVTAVTVIVRPQNSYVAIQRGWTSSPRAMARLTPYCQADREVWYRRVQNGGQPGQIFVAARRTRNGSREKRNTDVSRDKNAGTCRVFRRDVIELIWTRDRVQLIHRLVRREDYAVGCSGQ